MTKPKSKPTESAKSKQSPKAAGANSVVLFGADEFGKPRAARFTDADQALLMKAASTLHLRTIEVVGTELEDLAKKLPAGRLHADGQGLLPFVQGDLYAELIALTVGDQKPPADLKSSKGLPASRDDIGPGHLVVAHETLECGWWEAVVLERNGDLLTLRYRDYPNYPPLVRHLSAVALICPHYHAGRAERIRS